MPYPDQNTTVCLFSSLTINSVFSSLTINLIKTESLSEMKTH